MPCNHIESCELFTQFALNPALRLWQESFCQGEFTRCKRFQNSQKGLPIPLTLLPNGKILSVLHSQDELGAVAIFNAIVKKRAHMVRSLIKAGANPNAKNVEGKTPLMLAAELDCLEIVELLIEKNVDALAQTVQGETAYDLAVKRGHTKIAAVLRPHSNHLVAV